MKSTSPGGARCARGFTLIELLVVIAIIAILAAILFPVFANAKESARQTQCLAHGKQIATAVRLYVDDHNGRWPPLTGFNENPPAGQPGHRGPEETLQPYSKAKELFRCPNDNGGPSSGGQTYWQRYGQSFSLSSRCFSAIKGLSFVNDQDVTDTGGWFGFPERVITDSDFEEPSRTRIAREIMLPWFNDTADKYGQKAFYQKWHSRGGTLVFADGHAVTATSAGQYDDTLFAPSAAMAPNPAKGNRTGDDPVNSW